MKGRKKFSFKDRIRSFGYAFSGLRRFFLTEHNVWIHSAVALVVLIMSFLLKISSLEWVGVLFAVGLVLVAEAFNTCLEGLMDRLIPEEDETVKYIKDLAAGAVLISAIVAAIIGIIIFLPKIIHLL